MTLNLFVAAAVVLAWLALTWFTMMRKSACASGAAQGGQTVDDDQAQIAVVYASQTGTAQEIAQRTAHALGEQAALIAMHDLTLAHLARSRSALFIVSTYGEGDPPDMAQRFYETVMALDADPTRLATLDVAVLALGDRSYRHYCGFGQALSEWLKGQGAHFLFDTMLTDQGEQRTLDAWSAALAQTFGIQLNVQPHYEPWRLTMNHHVNPDSLGGPCHELRFQPEGPLPDWHAGDIAQILIADSGKHRDYSIASIPAEGHLTLLVRQHTDPHGRLGLGSGWLTRDLTPGATVSLLIRPNPLFHAPVEPRPTIFIGNGTGIAGLRSLLRQRVAHGRDQNWLIFGERQQARDFHFGDEIRTWLGAGKLRRLDLAFSRDQAEKRYVHHALRDAAAELRDWVAQGADIYVCGSKDGMAQDVDQALQEILGPYGYAALVARDGYRRDIY